MNSGAKVNGIRAKERSIIRLLSAVLICGSTVTYGWASDSVPLRIAAFETGLRPAISNCSGPETRWSLQERMDYWRVPGLSIAVIRHGKLAWARGYGRLQLGSDPSVDTQTVFSVGSLSKVAAAVITLRLADANKLDLDRDVNVYLKRWQVPQSSIAGGRAVTLRGILSHSAGLGVSGFKNFGPEEEIPTLVEVLGGVYPAKNEPVEIIYKPGTLAMYSGGGTTIEELAIEDITGLSFPAAASRHLFEPLRMTRSSFENPLPAEHGNIAKAHNNEGAPSALPRGWETMPQRAASGLWTTPSDYAKLMIALMEAYNGTGGFLKPELAREMMQEVGVSQFGLGPVLSRRGKERRFSHSGGNESYRAYMEGFPETGDGVVVLTNSRSSLNLIREVLRSIAASEGLPTGLSIQSPPVKLGNSELSELAGTYVVKHSDSLVHLRMRERGVEYRISHIGDGLFLDLPSGDVDTAREHGKARLTPVDSTHFVHDAVTSSSNDLQFFEFVRNYNGEMAGLVVRSGDYVIEADKVD